MHPVFAGILFPPDNLSCGAPESKSRYGLSAEFVTIVTLVVVVCALRATYDQPGADPRRPRKILLAYLLTVNRGRKLHPRIPPRFDNAQAYNASDYPTGLQLSALQPKKARDQR